MRTGEQSTTKTTVSVFQLEFTPEDKSIPYRFVGSYEYTKALDNFNQLLSISKENEIKVYDEFLVSRPEFSYYQGVSTAFREPPDLTKADPKARSRFNDRFQKGGLAWMMALAQIEVGATISMYGQMEKPFSAVVMSKFGNEEYLELLKDDLISHLKSLAQESLFQEVMKEGRTVDTWTLGYLRRLKIVKDLMVSISDVARPDTVAAMEPWFNELKEHEEKLVATVTAWLTPLVKTNSQTTTREVSDGRLMGETSRFGSSVRGLSPELIRECNRQIGHEVIDQPGSNRVKIRPPESRHGR